MVKGKDKDKPLTRKTLAFQYDNLTQDREPYLAKAKIAASYTIPSLLKDTDEDSVQTLRTPNQSIGADGVNNLSAKMTLTMLPPNQPFFKFNIDPYDMKNLATEQGISPEELEETVKRGLSQTEKMLVEYNERNGDRVCVGEGYKHLYIAGNVFLLHTPEGLKLYPLTRYVVQRDYQGNVLKAITMEQIGFYSLPTDIQDKVREKLQAEEKKDIDNLEERNFKLYTCYKRQKTTWAVWQEVEGFTIEETKGSYPIDIAPFMALRYTRIDGENYGRGLIEEYIGDISYLDVLSKAIKETSLAASKLLMLVKPNGIVNIKALNKAKNGDFVQANPDDIQPLQANKTSDLQVARLEKDSIERRLNRIFLLAQAVQRDSERTTATEIQYMIRDLEEALGNHYSIMSKEFQLAYIKISFFHMRKEKKNLPDLIREKSVKLTVTTGLEALGRGSDLNKWNVFFDTMNKFAQSSQIIGAKTEYIAQIVANSLNLDITGLLYTEEEKAQAMQQQQQEEMIKQVAPNIVNNMGKMQQEQQEEM